jgi:tetratricopeptide (TPR) repeat protein
MAIGALHMHRREYSRAILLFKRALLIRERSLGPEHAHVAETLSALAATYIDCGQYSDADELLKRAFAIAQRPGAEQQMTEILSNLGASAAKQGRYAEAEKYFHQTIEMCERLGALRHSTVVAALWSLGRVYVSLGQHVQAEKVLRRSLEISEEALGPNHLYTAGTLMTLAETLRKLRRGREARAYDRMARTMRDQHARENLTNFVLDVQPYKH